MKRSINPLHQAKRVVHKARRTKEVAKYRLSIARQFRFNVDSPRKKLIEERKLTVEGWIIPRHKKEFKLRVRNNDKIFPAEIGLRRLDVVKAHPDLDQQQALHSGFRAEFEFEDGEVAIEVDNGKGFKKLYGIKVQFGLENLPAAIYNKDLSDNYPEHVSLLENRKKLYYEDGLDSNFVRHEKDARLMAMYLPQFHPFEQNDKAWGKGFTEWSNVTTAQPRFIGHQQPILPKDLGYYDLRLESKILEQIELAKKYGVYGFCFYYYWFSGHKLMDKPLASFLAHKEWDFNFAICWANENWTKRWDGRNSDVIIAQEYLEEDPLNFIKDVEHILLDPRYTRESDKPVLMVYRASELKDPAKYAAVWREYFKSHHNIELQLVSFLSFDDQDPREYGFDAALDFAPLSAFFKNSMFPEHQFPYIDVSQKLLDINFSGVVADYRSIALNEKLSQAYDFPNYACLTPSWDNEARKKNKGFVYQNSSPDLYAEWLKRVVAKEQEAKDAPLIFVNAWNEWAEGAILEPSVHLGHAVLNRTVEVLSSQSNSQQNKDNFPAFSIRRKTSTKLAVIVHLYYVDLWPSIEQRLANITDDYDLFVTLNERDKGFNITPRSSNTQLHTFVLPNRGRDVLPFLYSLRRVEAAGYEYILKIHSKKSIHRKDGSNWFDDVLANLLPDTATAQQAIATLQEQDTGLIGPAGHLVSLKRHMGSNKLILENLIGRIYGKQTAKKVVNQPQHYPYFGGTMFWARVDALSPILSLHLMPDDFQSEHGQVDGTTAHAVERLIGVVAKLEHKRLLSISAHGIAELSTDNFVEKYTFAP